MRWGTFFLLKSWLVAWVVFFFLNHAYKHDLSEKTNCDEIVCDEIVFDCIHVCLRDKIKIFNLFGFDVK